MNNTIDNAYIFPNEPKKLVEKPIFTPGVRPSDPFPSDTLWGIHDPAIYKDPVSNLYYIYTTGAMCHESKDLITWERIGKVVEKPHEDSIKWVGDEGIWAPDIIKVDDEYRLYCSNSTWGVRQSCIFLAVADNPKGPFTPRGCVLKTSENLPVNAIDANIITDKDTGKMYMNYGSFWGGIHIIELDVKTGLAKEEGIGKCLARRPKWVDCAIEGPYIIYNEETDYYYLFVSYGSLKSDYNIRVGRSKSLLGPYRDYNGRDMTDMEDYTNEVGYLLHCGYKYGNSLAYMGPGHNSVLKDDDGCFYVVCHIREHNFHGPEISTMHINQMIFSSDGWPLLNPCEYAGERKAKIIPELLIGDYDRISLTPTIPQGISTSVPMSILPDGKVTIASINGNWEIIDEYTIVITYSNIVETYYLLPSFDYDTFKNCIALTGKNQNGICVRAKKYSS